MASRASGADMQLMKIDSAREREEAEKSCGCSGGRRLVPARENGVRQTDDKAGAPRRGMKGVLEGV